jgi:hypothetical protein
MAKHVDGTRDRAGIGPHLRPGVRLIPLRKHGTLSIVDGEPDIRGWDVRTVSGREIGKVDDLLVDSSVNEIVMLQIDLPGTTRHTLAPIRAAHIDRARRVVMLDSAELRDERDIPSLARDGELTEEEVRLFGERYERAYGRNVDYDARERGVSGAAATTGAAAAAAADLPRDREDASLRDENQALRAQNESLRDDQQRRVRYAQDGTEETVVERRPVVVEEVVVRRRVLDEGESASASPAKEERPVVDRDRRPDA